jgi:hypothetical protein
MTTDCRAARASDLRSRLAGEIAAVADFHFSELDSVRRKHWPR